MVEILWWYNRAFQLFHGIFPVVEFKCHVPRLPCSCDIIYNTIYVLKGWSQNWVKIFYLYNVKIAALQCKDSSPYPLPLYLYRCVFTHGQLWPSRPGNVPFQWMGRSPPPHALKVVWENCLTHLRSMASVLMSFSRHYHWNLRFFSGKYHMRLSCHWFGHIQVDRYTYILLDMVILDVGTYLASN